MVLDSRAGLLIVSVCLARSLISRLRQLFGQWPGGENKRVVGNGNRRCAGLSWLNMGEGPRDGGGWAGGHAARIDRREKRRGRAYRPQGEARPPKNVDKVDGWG